MVSRLVPEKRHIDLIRAFAEANLPEWKLVLVGALDHPDDYIRTVLSLSQPERNIVLTGFQGGSALQEFYANAGLFVLPNLEVGLPAEHYFPLGDVSVLSQMLRRFLAGKSDEQLGAEVRNWVKQRYDWERIAKQTLRVYVNITE